MSKPSNDISKLSFEDAINELNSIIETLETGEVSLEKAVDLYVRGNQLNSQCEKRLTDAKMKVEKVSINEKTQEITLEPFTE